MFAVLHMAWPGHWAKGSLKLLVSPPLFGCMWPPETSELRGWYWWLYDIRTVRMEKVGEDSFAEQGPRTAGHDN